jgi:uncharacterized protein (TIGR03067 family)
MMRHILIAGFITAATLGNSPRPESAGNPHKTDGNWRLISVEFHGETWEPAIDAARRWNIRGNQLTMQNGPGDEQAVSIKWDATSTPATFDVLEGGTTTLRGIYQITGQRLILCAGSEGRPAGFAPNPDRDERRIVLERETSGSRP